MSPFAREMKRHGKRLKMAAAQVRSYWEGMRDFARVQIRILRPREKEKAFAQIGQRSPRGLRCPICAKVATDAVELTVALGARGVVGVKRVLSDMCKLGLLPKGAARPGRRHSGNASSAPSFTAAGGGCAHQSAIRPHAT